MCDRMLYNKTVKSEQRVVEFFTENSCGNNTGTKLLCNERQKWFNIFFGEK